MGEEYVENELMVGDYCYLWDCGEGHKDYRYIIHNGHEEAALVSEKELSAIALNSPIGQKLVDALKKCMLESHSGLAGHIYTCPFCGLISPDTYEVHAPDCPRQLLLREIAEIEGKG